MSDKQALWWADAANSRLVFTLRHLVLSRITGVVRSWRASIRIDAEDPARSAVYAVIDAATLETDDPSRDEHIRSSEFLAVATNPEIQFRSRRVSRVDNQHFDVVGDLTVRGVTRELTLTMEDQGRSRDDSGRERATFHARVTVNRQDFGLRWNQDLDTGGVVVGDKVEVEVTVNAVADAQGLMTQAIPLGSATVT